MNPEEKREVYELTRRAVRHEIRAMIHDFLATVFGLVVFVVGTTVVINITLGSPSFWPGGVIGLLLASLGLLIVGITRKWDRWLHRHFSVGGTAQK